MAGPFRARASLSSKASGNRLLYAMQVSEKLPFDAYFADVRFESKKPDFTRSGSVCKSKSDSNIRPRLNGRDKNGWKRPLMKNRLQTSKTSGYLGVGGIQAHRAASFRLFSSAQNAVLEKPLLPNGNLSHIQEQDERKSSIRDQVNGSKF